MSTHTPPDTTLAPLDSNSVALSAQDLPAYCPNKKMTLWNSHPRVYLDITHDGHASCPYCGTNYRLESPAPAGH